MKKLLCNLAMLLTAVSMAAQGPQVRTQAGWVEGVDESGVKVFLGVPYAAPPVGDLRWRAPQPLQPWDGVRPTKAFGNDPMQLPIFGDMCFRGPSVSEDCLYLNIWTPAKTMDERLPVFIYFNGGGLMAGSGSEPRYDGMSYARNGIVALTVNYREGIFGFMAHPELSAETDYKGSGNYGFMDQAAAIRWVHDNIAAFGGDPDHITIMGESAGSHSVSVQMASPLARDCIAQAMGSSGAILATPCQTLAEAEAEGLAAMERAGCKSLAEMRALSAEEVQQRIPLTNMPRGNLDNYVLPKQPVEIFRSGEQAQVPCLIGNNSAEMPVIILSGYTSVPTMDGLKAGIKTWLKTDSDEVVNEVLGLYGISSEADMGTLGGYQLGGDCFIVYGTWRWTDLQQQTSSKPVYRYRYCKVRPDLVDQSRVSALAGGTVEKTDDTPATPAMPGAVHSADIEYQMGNLHNNMMYAWTADDFAVSEIFQSFFMNFIKTGNPNGLGLPQWDPINGEDVPPVMLIDVKSGQERDAALQARYKYLDKYLAF